MGKVVAAVRLIQRETNAAVGLVHHTGKPSQFGGSSERGSSALRGAADTMIHIDAPNNGLRVRVDKRKDDAPHPPMDFILKPVTVGTDARGKPVTSCVLVEDDAGPGAKVAPSGLTADNRVALEALSSCGNGDIAVKQWLTAFQKQTSQSSETLNRRRKWLEKNGYITSVRKGVYRITAVGEGTVKPLSRQSNDKTILQPLSHPFRGDSSGGDDGHETQDVEDLYDEAEAYAAWLDDHLGGELVH